MVLGQATGAVARKWRMVDGRSSRAYCLTCSGTGLCSEISNGAEALLSLSSRLVLDPRRDAWGLCQTTETL